MYTQARNLLALPREHPDIELILGEVLHVRTKVLADQVLEDCRHGGSLLLLTAGAHRVGEGRVGWDRWAAVAGRVRRRRLLFPHFDLWVAAVARRVVCARVEVMGREKVRCFL